MRPLLFTALFASGCFDLGKLDGRGQSMEPIDQASACPAPPTTMNSLSQDEAEVNVTEANGGWRLSPDITFGPVDGGCVPGTTSSQWFCSATAGAALYGPIATYVTGGSYRVHAWLRGDAPVDASFAAPPAGTLSLDFATNAGDFPMGPEIATFDMLGASWQEITTKWMGPPSALDMGLTYDGVEPVLAFSQPSCFVLNFVFLEEESP